MVLRPDQARALADVLLTGGDSESGAAAPDSGIMADGVPLGPQHIGRYRVTRLIGHGGMGAVYEAQQEHPARRVALKIVRAELVSPELARRLDHEARVLGRLEHPGIARIYEAGTWQPPVGGPSSPYFAMEYVEGKPLTEYVKEHKLSLKDRLELFIAVCDAVEHAHRRGIIHRDLKPGNILVDAEGNPRVLDFGLARATDADVRATTIHTEVGKLVGTLPYMSPEQVSGDSDATDTRSDVYSLGVVLYEMLAGKPPYQIGRGAAGGIAEAARIIRDIEPAPLSSIDRVFRGDLEVIVGKALAKEKDRRYQSVSDLAGDMRRYLRHEPIEARRASVWYQARAFASRNRPFVAAAMFATLALCAATIATSIMAVREARARGLAEREATRAGAREADALRETTIARAVVEFFQDMIVAAAPEDRGQDVPVSEVVERAAQSLEAVKDSDTQNALRESIAHLLGSLGRYPEAIKHFRAVFSFRRDRYGMQNRDTLSSLLNLVSTLVHFNDREEAASLAATGYDAAVRLGGEDDLLALSFRARQAVCWLRAGEPERARQMAESVLEAQRRVAGPSHPDTLETMTTLALACIETAEWPRAEAILREQLDTRTDLFGEHHPEVLSSISNLALALKQQDRLDEASEQLNRGLAVAGVLLGPDHPRTLHLRTGLAVILRSTGKAGEAVEAFRAVVAGYERTNGPDHPDTIGGLTLLGAAQRDAGDLTGAESTLTRAVDSHTRVLGADHVETLIALDHLITTVRASGDLPRAERLARQALDSALGSMGMEHPETLLAINTLARILKDAGKLEEAAQRWRVALDGALALLPAGHSYSVLFQINLGRCLIDLGRLEDAEPLLREAYELSVAHMGESSARARQAIEGMIALLEARELGADAAEWRAKLQTVRPKPAP